MFGKPHVVQTPDLVDDRERETNLPIAMLFGYDVYRRDAKGLVVVELVSGGTGGGHATPGLESSRC